MTYREFLESKATLAPAAGLACEPSDFHPILKPHQRATCVWAARGGRRGIFLRFGLGKSMIQIETTRVILERAGGRGLIVIPLGVRQEFLRDAAKVGVTLRFIRRSEEATDPSGLYLTNYESVREGKVSGEGFTVVCLDEAACLRSFGSKTFASFLYGTFTDVPYRFVATATPDPNEYVELLAYAQFLGIMDIGQAKTRFFKRDSEHADRLTLYPHRERDFWLWLASWALFMDRPSDLGYPDDGYTLPPLDVHWHELPSNHAAAAPEAGGQMRMYREATFGVSEAAREKRDTLSARVAKLLELRALDPPAHRVIWHDLEAERHAIERAIPGVTSAYGNQDLDERERAIIAFSDGEIPELSTKPVIAGSGTNLQRHCAWAIYLGIGFKFNDFIQSIHRLHRFLQERPVRVDLIYTEAERPVRRALEAKWRRYDAQVATMSRILREYGLAEVAMARALTRTLGVERQETAGDGYRLVNNDCVLETQAMAADSVDAVITSLPFSGQYEYTPTFEDFGHTADDDEFWRQMDFLAPELFRVLRPGRVLALHIKDRVMPGAMTGLGFQTVNPFHCAATTHFIGHGFAYLGSITVITDVVRENAQTYRLGWTEQVKDGSRMGAGLPELVLLFRRPPTDHSDGYADVPVATEKPLVVDEQGQAVPWREGRPIIPGTGSSRARWQFVAHGLWRSNGNRLLTPEDLGGRNRREIFRAFREYSASTVSDHERDVALGEALEARGQLPPDYMLLQPQSWHPDVWTDVMRPRSMNTLQARAGREKHLCPLPFDIVDRLIDRYTMKGETIYDPFGGLATVALCAIKRGRQAITCELSPVYWRDGARYVEAAARERAIPDLYELLATEEADAR